ncbi:uncharacterized protein ACWYII_008903 [Salvelinus alpinus]
MRGHCPSSPSLMELLPSLLALSLSASMRGHCPSSPSLMELLPSLLALSLSASMRGHCPSSPSLMELLPSLLALSLPASIGGHCPRSPSLMELLPSLLSLSSLSDGAAAFTPVTVTTSQHEGALPQQSLSDGAAAFTPGTVTVSQHEGALPQQSLSDGAAAFTPVTVTVSQHEGALPQQSLSDGALMVGRKPLSRVASGAERYPETVEALRDVGRLRERHNTLETRVELLEAGKADQAQLQHLREHLTDMGDRDVPDKLLDQLNHLRVLVDSLMGDRAKSSKLMNDVQGAIMQLQAECEKLHGTANHLIEEHSQKQVHIDHLYKSMEELDEKKADKELVEMEIEILDRIELDPVKKQLEDRWKSIRKQLQAQPAPKEDDAAGIRKQLVARFHCISCDRPVDMLTPGPHLVTVPSTPGLPSHKSNRPHTIYELEQVRQHCRASASLRWRTTVTWPCPGAVEAATP